MEENKNQMAYMAENVNCEPLDDLPFFDDEETATEETETEQMTETPTEDENESLKADTATESDESVEETADESENENVSEEKAEESADTETEKAKEDYISQPEQRILDEMNRRVSEDGDELLSTAMQSADKNIHDCYKYVTFCARKEMEKIMKGKSSGGVMIDDPIVYGWAHHYYIESKETIDAEMKPKVTATPKVTPPKADNKKTAKKGKKKAKETPKPIKNVIDLSKVITAKKPEEDGKKKTKREKKKDSLSAGFVPMERPDCANYEKEAKKGSREQAKSVSQMDLFADFFAE